MHYMRMLQCEMGNRTYCDESLGDFPLSRLIERGETDRVATGQCDVQKVGGGFTQSAFARDCGRLVAFGLCGRGELAGRAHVHLHGCVQLGDRNVGLGSFRTGEQFARECAQKRLGTIRSIESESAVPIVLDPEQAAAICGFVRIYTSVIKDFSLIEIP